MFAFLLASPRILAGFIIFSLLSLCVIYVFYTQNEIKRLNLENQLNLTQISENNLTISDLNNRIMLLQKLNNNFSSAINLIQQKEDVTIQALKAFNIRQQAQTNPHAAQDYVTVKVNNIFHQLNSITTGK
jgi:hypothetical protein